MTDRQLLDRFITAKDSDAFAALIKNHGPMVLGVCRTVLYEQHDVEDAFQTTFLILVSRASTIKHTETIGPWLHRVALRVANKARFKTAQRRAHERNAAETGPTHSQEPPDSSLVGLLREEVGRLPDRYRLPVTLCYLEEKSNQEAAAQLRCPVGTIKGRLSRARETLRARLSRRGLVPGRDSLGAVAGG